jgi:coiled-coil domain-containing protein 55
MRRIVLNISLLFYSEAEKKKRGTASTGMAHFYRKLLDESEQQHAETVQATTSSTTKGPQGPALNLTITKPPDMAPKSDVELARIAREQGKEVELNDDNQIVDKRDLLSAGLNLSAPNTRRLGLTVSKDKSDNEPMQTHRAVGTAASRREINERRTREIRQQMVQEEERVREEKEREEYERTQRIVAKRNQEDDVLSAKERYLARKKRKLEEVAATANGETAEPSPS